MAMPKAPFALLADAQRVFVSEYYPLVRPIPAQVARIHAGRGHLRDAEAWVRERGLSVDDALTYVGEYEHITLARVLLARATRLHDPRSIQQAVALLERLLVAAETGGRWRSVVEILILQALAHDERRGPASGLDSLVRALTLAEPEGYVRSFVGEGASMARMLTLAAKRGVTPDVRSTPARRFRTERSFVSRCVRVSRSRSASGSLMSCGCSPRTLMAPVLPTSWSWG